MMQPYKKGDLFPNLPIRTAYEPDRQVTDILKGKTIFWVLRYIGCPVCRLDVQLIAERYAEFQAKNAQVFVVMQSDAAHVRAALQDRQLPFDIVCDEDMTFYRTLMIRPAESMEQLAGQRLEELQAKGAKADACGYTHGDYEGDELQLPALFIVDEHRVIDYAHYAKELIDMPTVEEVLTML